MRQTDQPMRLSNRPTNFRSGCFAAGLIATGFVIIYKATSVINFATGELMMLGAFFTYTAMEVARAPFIVALLVAALGAAASACWWSAAWPG